MKKQILGLTIAAGALWVGAPGCDQPDPECTVGTASASPYVAKFYQINPPPAGMETPCDGIVGDLIGMQLYNPESGGVPDNSRKMLAIQTSLLGGSLYPDFSEDPADEQDTATLVGYSMGDFTSGDPDSSDMCHVPQLDLAQIVHPEVERFANGEECGADTHCLSGICNVAREVCSDPLELGEECAADNHCLSGICDVHEEVCSDPLPNGSECAAGHHCESGFCNLVTETCEAPQEDSCCGDGTCDPTDTCTSCEDDCGPCETGPDGPAQESKSLAVEWSDIKVYVTAAFLGNQAQGQLTYRDELAGCSATYNVVMLWPAVGCEKVQFFKDRIPPAADNVCAEVALCDVSAEGRPDCVPCDPAVDGEEVCHAYGLGEPEPKLCDEEPDPEPEYALPVGSGISPELNVECDPELLYCVLKGESIPAFR